jgi:hypothetical protein
MREFNLNKKKLFNDQNASNTLSYLSLLTNFFSRCLPEQ